MEGNESANELESVETTGKNVDEAIDNALVDLGLERHEVTIEVLAQGRAGLFGIGGEPARVRVSPAPFEEPEGDDVELAVAGPSVALDDRVAECAQVIAGDLLTAGSEASARDRHRGHVR